MKTLRFLFILTLAAVAGRASAQTAAAPPKISLDKIVGKVDNFYILKSDVETMYYQYGGGQDPKAPTLCQCMESQLINKVMLAKAEIDSVVVDDKEVENQLSGRMDQFIAQYGSEKNIVEQFGKTINQLKAELRPEVRNQLVAQKMQATITENVKITPKEVKRFFDDIPKDSIPYLPSEVEVGQIVRVANVTKEEKDKLRERLVDIKRRIQEGEDFGKLAELYSEDVESAKRGGVLGFAKRGMMVPEFEAAAMKLEPNQLSEIVESDFGLHLIQLMEKRGQEYLSRHILLRPDYNRLDLSEPTRYLDSLRTLILADSIKFEKAAREYSEDKMTSETGGLLMDPETRSARMSLDASMETYLYLTLDTMKVGTISKPMEYRTPDGKSAVRILYYKTKYPPHYANFKDDYPKLQQYALSAKRSRAVDEWLRKTKSEVYVIVDPEFAECDGVKEVLTTGQ
jgi:peptidyl-prolyl cis-trans isomerase SurA